MKLSPKTLAAGLAAVLLAVPMYLAAAPVPGPSGLPNAVRHELVMLPYYTLFDDLSFKADGNTVTLYGEVTNPVLKSDAEHVVKRIEGVDKVVNNIRVLPLSPFDNQIRRAEYRAIFGYSSMYRYAMGALPSIHIIVDNGHVTLEGVVANQGDRNIAGIRANAVPGVFSVTNNLQVENGKG